MLDSAGTAVTGQIHSRARTNDSQSRIRDIARRVLMSKSVVDCPELNHKSITLSRCQG